MTSLPLGRHANVLMFSRATLRVSHKRVPIINRPEERERGRLRSYVKLLPEAGLALLSLLQLLRGLIQLLHSAVDCSTSSVSVSNSSDPTVYLSFCTQRTTTHGAADRTKSPGLDSDSRTRKVPGSSRAASSFSAFGPDRCKQIKMQPLGMHRPLGGGVGAVERVLEIDGGAVPVLQDAVLRRVVLHQLGQGGKLLPAIQVVVVSCVLDPDVGHQLAHPEEMKPFAK
ncbi:hypothetical protein EYF80_035260 [Liparis tanakae]|uniref:Uncharacterized protein n=1 Tax=Liparis tanakae TaxID=230148 RepID=A0A4Z2GLX4_9TELE|nr:hypothetical protein EYF80_035260 [Liparis tanakae]